MKLTKSIGLALALVVGLALCTTGTVQAETDVTSKVQVIKGALSYDRVKKQSYLNVSMKNISGEVLLAPITVMVDSVTPSTITVANADGKTADGKAYLTFATETGQLLPGATTNAKKLVFANPTAVKFSFSSKIMGLLPDAEKVVGPTGGVVEFTDSQDPKVKVIIEIPPGALLSDSHIAISEDTSSNRNPPLGYNSIGPRIRLTSSTPLSKFVKVQLPVSGNISQDDLVLVSHYDEKIGQFTNIPVDFTDYSLNLVAFTMPSFCTVEPVKISGLPETDQFNMNIFYNNGYPFLINLVNNYQLNIDNINTNDEKLLKYIDTIVLDATKTVDLYEAMNGLNTKEQFAIAVNNQFTDFAVKSIDLIVPENTNKDWINPTIDLLLCTYQGAFEAYVDKVDARYTILESCGLESFKQAFSASVMFNDALKINGETKRINEAWITIDYMKFFYSNGGDYDKMAAALINKMPATEDAIINEVARFSYKNGLFAWNDYDLKRVKTLIGEVKNMVDGVRSEIDPDSDLVPQKYDKCSNTAPGDIVNNYGCSQSDLSYLDNDEDGFRPIDGDCNDNDPAMNPNTVLYQDADGDGYADGTTATQCLRGLYYNKLASELKSLDIDCNDNDPAVGPATLYLDADNDGYGNPNVSISGCAQPSGYVTSNTDCNDSNAFVHPGAIDVPGDGTDQDCSGTDQAPAPVSPGTFTTTGSMKNIRYHHTATLLPDGKVLVAGGAVGRETPVLQAELYDPQTETFSATGSLNVGRFFHRATKLQNNKVLITGGYKSINSSIPVYFNSAEIYDPATGVFQITGNMNFARRFHTSTLLGNGMVLITGGTGAGDVYLDSAELFDPATNKFTLLTSKLSAAIDGHTATLLDSGKVLIVGGNGKGIVASYGEIYDPATGVFSKTGNMVLGRGGHTSVKLLDGKVLVTGGSYNNMDWVSPTISEQYDPSTNSFAPTGSIRQPRTTGGSVSGAEVTLPNGNVLIAGGGYFDKSSNLWTYRNSAEIYNHQTGLFSDAAPMSIARVAHSVTMLENGKVLVAGGIERYSGSNGLSSAELFTP